MKLSERLSRVGQVLHQRMAEHPVKSIVLEGERIAVSGFELDIPDQSARGAYACSFYLRGSEIYPNNPTRSDAERRYPGLWFPVRNHNQVRRALKLGRAERIVRATQASAWT